VAAALKTWRDQRKAGPEDPVFIDENGGALELQHLANRARDALRTAGLDRPGLFSRGPLQEHFGTHCFPRTLVTRHLALGRNEDWVRQRSGHRSEELLTYRQAAKALAELELGDVDPLDDAIPELRGELSNPPPKPPHGSPQKRPPSGRRGTEGGTEQSGRGDSNHRPL